MTLRRILLLVVVVVLGIAAILIAGHYVRREADPAAVPADLQMDG